MIRAFCRDSRGRVAAQPICRDSANFEFFSFSSEFVLLICRSVAQSVLISRCANGREVTQSPCSTLQLGPTSAAPRCNRWTSNDAAFFKMNLATFSNKPPSRASIARSTSAQRFARQPRSLLFTVPNRNARSRGHFLVQWDCSRPFARPVTSLFSALALVVNRESDIARTE